MKQLFTLLIVAIIALAFWSMKIYEDKKEIIDIEEAEPHFIDLYIKNFTLTVMDETGSPSYTLNADHLEHYRDTAHSIIAKPVIHLLQAGNRWLISAQNGEINEKQNRIMLMGDVVMLQQDKDFPVELTTSQLEIDTDRQIAQTDRVVHIVQQEYRLKSDGMILDNATGELELLASVEGSYARAD